MALWRRRITPTTNTFDEHVMAVRDRYLTSSPPLRTGIPA